MLPTDLLCYYPTNIAVIDDSASFLAMINKELDLKRPRQLYNNPLEALTEINSAEKSSNQLNRLLKSLLLEDIDDALPSVNYDANALIYVDFGHLYDEVYNPKRFDRVAVVLVDYRMEQMDGIEFCRRLTDKSIIKIMITEISGYKLAVQAFNEGVIDKFILKNSPDFFAKINSSIAKAQGDYFRNIYSLDGILGFIFRHQLQLSALNYDEVIGQINKVMEPVEYYLLDKFGSTLFLNDKAEPLWLIIRPENELDKLYGIAKDNKAPKSILNALYNKQEMPILLCEEDYKLSVKDWLLCPMKSFSSRKKEYYSIITKHIFPFINLEKITSFKQYAKGNVQKFYK